MSTSRTVVRARVGVAIATAMAIVAAAFVFSTDGSDRVAVRQRRMIPLAVIREKMSLAGDEDGEGEREGLGGPSVQAYDDRAYPRDSISFRQVRGTYQAFRDVPRANSLDSSGSLAPVSGSWQELGPYTPSVPASATYTDKATMNSGRVTSMAIGPSCSKSSCRVWVGAAGGGVWRTSNALASTPTWTPLVGGLTSQSIGSLAVDPNDASGNTIYAGTGEPNGSGDSEAGVGLFKSTNGGTSWTLVPGSVAVAKNRSIASIAIDPTNASHYYIGTAVARHGSSSANGGRRTPPGAPELGLYETTDGGATFTRIFSQAPNPTDPATGNDWFQGGVINVQLDPSNPKTVYASVLGYGLWRRSKALDGDTSFHQVFATKNPVDTYGDRTEYDLVKMGSKTRVYLGDSSDDLGYSVLWRVDDANVPADTLYDGGANTGWTLLSDPMNGSPGYGSYGFCQAQCGYDMFVSSPAGRPDEVWIGGSMNYDELPVFGGNGRSNGRAVMRSTNAGVSFTDMTNESVDPPIGMHPDQHAVVFSPNNPNIAFVGSDGGVIRTSGGYVDDSAECADRPIAALDLKDCQLWLSSVPQRLLTLNDGLRTIQFQSLSLNPADPTHDALGGTQDNGTFVYTGGPTWTETIDGDGGQSGTDVGSPNIRVHSYYSAQIDVNFHGTRSMGWDWIADPLLQSQELASFYIPLIMDPTVSGTMYTGLQHVWRTPDSGGSQAFLDRVCNEYTGTFSKPCGDWQALGGPKGDLTGTAYGTSRAGHYVVATERAPSDTGTLWAATRIGRVFVSKNADAATPSSVTFTRIDTDTTPGRFISGIAIDPADPNHAYVSYSGYEAYTPGQPGHVFSVRFDPGTGTAAWRDLSANIGDQPITDVVYDDQTGDLYASTDFGVLRLEAGTGTWTKAASGLPPVATYGLTIDTDARVLYAATHGRGAWRLGLP